MALALQWLWRYKRRTRRRSLIEERLATNPIATTVQQRLFPESPPVMASLGFGCLLSGARVGGDYYDFIVLDQGKVGIAVADVAGKGYQRRC
jgi:serine phosphatase RsbU (regulator of sigma subunit)